MSYFSDDVTLGRARAWLREQAQGDGAACPCCTQFTKIYRRSITSRMARGLISMWTAGRRSNREPVYMPRAGDLGGDAAKLRYWGLIVEEAVEREDGGRAGWWRVTEAGEAFVRGVSRQPKYAYVYDGRCLKVDGDLVSIHDALGNKFDLRELLALDAHLEEVR